MVASATDLDVSTLYTLPFPSGWIESSKQSARRQITLRSCHARSRRSYECVWYVFVLSLLLLSSILVRLWVSTRITLSAPSPQHIPSGIDGTLPLPCVLLVRVLVELAVRPDSSRAFAIFCVFLALPFARVLPVSFPSILSSTYLRRAVLTPWLRRPSPPLTVYPYL